MTDLELVTKAEHVIEDVVRHRGATTAELLEQLVAEDDASLERPIVGLAVLRLLREARLSLNEEYEFVTVTQAPETASIGA